MTFTVELSNLIIILECVKHWRRLLGHIMKYIKLQLQGSGPWNVATDYPKKNNSTKVLVYFAINHDALHILMEESPSF